MSLASQVKELSVDQLHQLLNVMLDACAALELGGNWREPIRRARHRNVGRQRRIYDLLYDASASDIRIAAAHLVDHLR